VYDSEGSIPRYEARHDHLPELFREDEEDFVFFFDSGGDYGMAGGGWVSAGVAVWVCGGVGWVVAGVVIVVGVGGIRYGGGGPIP